MTAAKRKRVAQAITAMSYGRTMYAVTPILAAANQAQREAVYRLLGGEFEDFAETVLRLIEGGQRNGTNREPS